MATELHAGQTRKGTDIPYMSHLLAVSALVMEHGGTDDECVAALLHDAVEDQGGVDTERRIRSEFGDAVADIVMQCSDTAESPKPPWRGRKERYLARLAGDASDSAVLVSVCDRIANGRAAVAALREKGPAMWDALDAGGERLFNAGADEQVWFTCAYVNAVVPRLNRTHRSRLRMELFDVLGEVVRRAVGRGDRTADSAEHEHREYEIETLWWRAKCGVVPPHMSPQQTRDWERMRAELAEHPDAVMPLHSW